VTLKLRVLPRARVDILDQATYFATEEGENLSQRFLQGVEGTLSRLAEFPDLGSKRTFGNPRLATLLIWPTQGFPKHFIVYRVLEDHLEIVRVLHAARDIPGGLESDRF